MRPDHVQRQSLLSISDLSSDQLRKVIEIAREYSTAPKAFAGRLAATRIGLVFTAPSTRTRTSFWSAATTLGCDVLHFGPNDLQITTGETWRDTANVLNRYLDIAVVRTNGPQHDLIEFAEKMPATINALTYEEHPTQAIADFCAISDYFENIETCRIAYLGSVNNTARSLCLMACNLHLPKINIYSPTGFGLSKEELNDLNNISNTMICQYNEIPAALEPADIVYTTRWLSMGASPPEKDWLSKFGPFGVSVDLMNRFSSRRAAVFMHDLPAVRNQEATSDVIDGTSVQSLVGNQVRHKESAAAAALLWASGRI